MRMLTDAQIDILLTKAYEKGYETAKHDLENGITPELYKEARNSNLYEILKALIYDNRSSYPIR